MTDIEFKVENIGGHLGSHSERIKRGKLNLVEGTSASGKSSLVRGAHFALVGGVTDIKEGPIAKEIKKLHLNDSTSEGYGLIHTGTRSGSAEVSTDNLMFTATIAKSGAVTGTGNNMKAAYTTMLSSQPESFLYAAVIRETNGNDFSWVTEHLSEANNYLSWSNILHQVKQEIQTKKVEFENWKSNSQDVEATIASLESEEKELVKLSDSLGKEGGDELDNANEELNKSQALFNSATKNAEKTRANVVEMESENRTAQQAKDDAETDLRNAQRRIDAIDDALEEGLHIPDTTDLDIQINNLRLDKATASGQNGDAWEIPEILDALSKSEISGSGAKSVRSWEDTVREKLGDNDEMLRITTALNELERKRGSIHADSAAKKAAFANARENKRDYKNQVDEARKNISLANNSMPITTSALRERQEKLKTDENKAMNSEEEMKIWAEKVKALSNNPELDKVNDEKEAIGRKIKSLLEDKTSHYLLHYDSLGMRVSDTDELTEEKGDAHFAGIEKSDVCIDKVIEKNIEASDSEKEGILIRMLKTGKLSEAINATVVYVDNKATEHREKAREIFNEVGSSIFSSLSFSPMTKMELDDSYELKITWKDGRVTGLSGSGGERNVIAAAMLIAMRAAYTPEIPFLMFDGMLENLNKNARQELEQFLASYAEATDIAVVATLLTDSDELVISYL